MFNQYKNVLYFAILVAVTYGFYAYFFGAPAVSDITVTSADSVQDATTVKLLTNLNKITTVVIDENFFTDRVFTSLVDFSKPLQDELSGRPNPFEPFIKSNTNSIGTSSLSR